MSDKAPFSLPQLPYADDALEPHISKNTLGFHYGKHHKAYVDNTNKLVAGTPLADHSLEGLIKAVAGKPDQVGIFNNSAQIWNHTFYWHSMRKDGGGRPPQKLESLITRDFADFDKFKEALTTAATTQFGSGWAWLVSEGGKLKVMKTPNAETPLTSGATPLLTIDVWEHAYYLDYQNRRPDYVATFLNHLANWDFALQNLEKA